MQHIGLSDITLKTADGNALSFKEKIELAKLLDKLNVASIELSPIENRKIDSLLVKSIAMAVKNSAVAVPVTQDAQSIDTAWAALKEAKKPRLQLKAPMSPMQMEYFWHKKPDKMLEAIQDIITRCRALCADVEFIADDACRSEKDFLYKAVRTAIEAGATGVTLCDAAGLMFPEEFSAFIEDVKANVPEVESVRLGVQCSDALSMAAACAMAAIRAGAADIKTVASAGDVTQIGDIAAILQNRGDSFGFGSDVRTSELKRITAQVERLLSGVRSQRSPYEGGVSAVAEAGGMEDKNARLLGSFLLIGFSVLLTALNVFDNVAKHAGAGTIVPITGFANSMASPAQEFKSEGLILGTGAKMFSIAGPVLVYGIVTSVVYGIVYWIMQML